MKARVTLIPSKCPPAFCATCRRPLFMHKGKRSAVLVQSYDASGRWLDRNQLHHTTCYDGAHGEPQRRSA